MAFLEEPAVDAGRGEYARDIGQEILAAAIQVQPA
jgi:hypothetical protein